ncbi:MAG: hypothetical protein M3R24_08040, partial [Chloroflexota bacterium]|nr:hypothetical protein [Chloroflexota bacterium]
MHTIVRHLLDLSISKNNLLLATAIDDMLTAQRAEVLQLAKQATGTVDFSRMTANLANISQAYDTLFQYEIEHYIPNISGRTPPLLAERLIVPTASVAHYTHSVRNFVEAEIEVDERPILERSFD